MSSIDLDLRSNWGFRMKSANIVCKLQCLCSVEVKAGGLHWLCRALCRAALMMLPSSAALCEKSKRRRRVGREPLLRRLGSFTVHGHWCCCWMDEARVSTGMATAEDLTCRCFSAWYPNILVLAAPGFSDVFLHFCLWQLARWFSFDTQLTGGFLINTGLKQTGHYDLSIRQ